MNIFLSQGNKTLIGLYLAMQQYRLEGCIHSYNRSLLVQLKRLQGSVVLFKVHLKGIGTKFEKIRCDIMLNRVSRECTLKVIHLNAKNAREFKNHLIRLYE